MIGRNEDPVKELKRLAGEFIPELRVPEIVGRVLDHPDFAVWTGSGQPTSHHYGRGGLARHVYEVVFLCQRTRQAYWDRATDDVVLFVAAVFHDFGKLWDHAPIAGWKDTEHKRNIHHISRSAIEFNLHAAKLGLDQKFIDKVTHCILSHHGRREAGSPVAPKSREAWILHLCDNMSARLDDHDKMDIIDRYGK